jgi:L-lactate dehydrogenase complex protein LldG
MAMAEADKDPKPWNERIQERLSRPEQLDGLRSSFRTTLDRQRDNLCMLPDLEERRERARTVRGASVKDDRLLDLALERLRANRIRVIGPLSKRGARESILEEIGEQKLVVKSKSNVTKELELSKFLQSKGIEVVETDAGDRIIQIAGLKQAHPTGPAADLTRHDIARILSVYLGREVGPDPDSLIRILREDVRRSIERADIGITGANFLAAEEGAAVLSHNEGNAAECARRPLKHIIVTSTDKVVPDIEEAINLIKLQTFYATGRIVTQYVNVISGPSLTADIEKLPFYGMHGPKEVVLVLIDNHRSEVEDRGILECFNCGSCLLKCPVYDIVGKDFGGPAYLGGRGVAFTARIDGAKTSVDSGLTLCTNCGLCTEMCPIRLDTPRYVREARRLAQREGLAPTAEQAVLVRSIRDLRNPRMQPPQARARWAEHLRLRRRGKVLYFAGCYPSLVDPELSLATIEVLSSAGLELSYLGKDEACCGSVLQKIGEDETFLETARNSARRILESGAEKVITTCPGCFRTLSDYRERMDGFDVEVEHVSQTMAGLIDRGKLKFGRLDLEVTYHDPCDLGRLGGVFDEPRKVLEAMPGLRVREMRDNRSRSLCCGAGGGVKTAHPGLAERIGARRVASAEETGARALVTSCFGCERNLRDACAASGSKMEVWDLVVLARKALSG